MHTRLEANIHKQGLALANIQNQADLVLADMHEQALAPGSSLTWCQQVFYQWQCRSCLLFRLRYNEALNW